MTPIIGNRETQCLPVTDYDCCGCVRGVLAGSSSAASRRRIRTGSTIPRSIGNIMPYSACLRLCYRQTEVAYFRDPRRGGSNGRISFLSYDDCYSPEDLVERRAACESVKCLSFSIRSVRPVRCLDSQIHDSKKGAAVVLPPPAPPSGTIPKKISWTMSGIPTPKCHADLCQIYPNGKTLRENRRLYITTITARLSEGGSRRARRQAASMIIAEKASIPRNPRSTTHRQLNRPVPTSSSTSRRRIRTQRSRRWRKSSGALCTSSQVSASVGT